MNGKTHLLAALLLSALAACTTSTPSSTCADFCGTGNVCVDGSCVPLACTPSCGPGTACQMGSVRHRRRPDLHRDLPGCSSCDTSGATPAWVGQCGAGTACQAGSDSCVPLACTPSCGPGTACQMGQCVTVAALTCTATYPGCSSCDTSGATPTWRGLCGTGTTCDATADRCVQVTGTLHATLTQPGLPLAGPFASGYAVTAACVQCHAGAADNHGVRPLDVGRSHSPPGVNHRPRHPGEPGQHREGQPHQQLLRGRPVEREALRPVPRRLRR